MSCKELGCENQGRCEEKICTCNVGYAGAYCETEINVDTPRFFGNSFLMVKNIKNVDKRRNTKQYNNMNFIHLNVSTVNHNGVILWSVKVRITLE